MALGDEESEQRRRFAASLQHADVSIEELWLRYFTLGGQAGQFEVEAYIHGAMALPALQRDILAHALNERLDELFSEAPRAPYSVDSHDDEAAEPDDQAAGSDVEPEPNSADEPEPNSDDGSGPEPESGPERGSGSGDA